MGVRVRAYVHERAQIPTGGANDAGAVLCTWLYFWRACLRLWLCVREASLVCLLWMCVLCWLWRDCDVAVHLGQLVSRENVAQHVQLLLEHGDSLLHSGALRFIHISVLLVGLRQARLHLLAGGQGGGTGLLVGQQGRLGLESGKGSREGRTGLLLSSTRRELRLHAPPPVPNPSTTPTYPPTCASSVSTPLCTTCAIALSGSRAREASRPLVTRSRSRDACAAISSRSTA